MLVKDAHIGLHTEGVGTCREPFERDFEVAGEGRLGVVVAKDGATQRIDEQELRGRDAGERELHVANGGVGTEGDGVSGIVEVADAGKVAGGGVLPDGEEGPVAVDIGNGAGLIDGVEPLAVAAPAKEDAVFLGEGALGHFDAVARAVGLGVHESAAAVGVEVDIVVGDGLEVETADGVEVLEEGVVGAAGEGVVEEGVLGVEAADGVVVVDGVECFGDGFNVEEGALVVVEGVGGIAARAAGARGEVVDSVEAVAAAAPTPVEVVIAGAGGAVEDEGVAALTVVAVVEDGATCRHFGVDVGSPFGFGGEVVAGDGEDGGVVFEVLDESVFGAGGVGTVPGGSVSAAGGAIVHVHGDAAMVGDGGEGGSLFGGGGHADTVGHARPVVGGVGEVGGEGAVVFVGIGVGAGAAGGVTPEFHDLCHCGGDASHDGAEATFLVVGAEVVVGRALVPGGGEERTDGVARSGEERSTGGGEGLPGADDGGRGLPHLGGCGDLRIIATEPIAELAVELLGQRGVEGVAEDGLDTVVGGEDNEAGLAVDEEVEMLQFVDHQLVEPFDRLDVLRALAVPEMDGGIAGGVDADGCRKGGGEEKYCRKDGD